MVQWYDGTSGCYSCHTTMTSSSNRQAYVQPLPALVYHVDGLCFDFDFDFAICYLLLLIGFVGVVSLAGGDATWGSNHHFIPTQESPMPWDNHP